MTRRPGIFTPAEAVDKTIAFVEQQMANPNTGIKALIPGDPSQIDLWKAGDCIGILAYTSNGKSSFVAYVINQHAYQLRSYIKEHPNYNHVTVYVSWEQPIEQMIGVDFSRVTGLKVSDILYGNVTQNQLERMKESGELRKQLPIWLIGHSIYDKRGRKMLTMDEVSQLLAWIEEEAHMIIDMIVLDYLQRIRWLGDNKVLGVEQNCDEARTMAKKCPVILVSQAGRETQNRDNPMPRIQDSQWSSNFEQSCTHVYALWRPQQNHAETIKVNGRVYKVEEHMLVFEALKQTLGPINFKRVFDFGYGGTYLREWGEQPIEERRELFV